MTLLDQLWIDAHEIMDIDDNDPNIEERKRMFYLGIGTMFKHVIGQKPINPNEFANELNKYFEIGQYKAQ